MRRDFVANVSHEIRTPLTVVAGFVETLQSVPLSTEEQTRYLQLMAQQTDRMQALVSDLLALCSRLEGSPPPSAGQWVDVAAVMRDVEQESHALALLLAGDADTPHAIRFDGGDGWQVAGSAAELRSALVNLVKQRGALYPARQRPDRCALQTRLGWPLRMVGTRPRPRHCARTSAATVRTLLPGRPQPFTRNWRHRSGSGNRQARGAAAWRRVAHRQRIGPWLAFCVGAAGSADTLWTGERNRHCCDGFGPSGNGQPMIGLAEKVNIADPAELSRCQFCASPVKRKNWL